jgi:GNAT superfamily N-acetyltransferase
MTDLDIRPLTDDTWDALVELFSEGGEPGWCWCAFWRTRGAGGARSEAEENRALLHRLASRPGTAPGLVGLRGDRAVGWVSLGPRTELPRLVRSRTLAPVDDRPVWAIICFAVSRSARGEGVASTLLAAAVDYAREHGATTLEAYPRDTAGERMPASSLNTGTPGMFEQAGFTPVATRQAAPNARPRLIMRYDVT